MPIVPAGLLYHATPARLRPVLRREGILPQAGEVRLPDGRRHRWGPRVFLATLMPAAVEIASMLAEIRGEDMTIAEIDPARIPGLSLRADPEFDHGVWTARAIPPDAIRRWRDPDSLDPDGPLFTAYIEGRFGRDGRRLPA